MKPRWWIPLLAIPIALLLKGCGDDSETDAGASRAATGQVQALRAPFHDWDTITLRNDLVSIAIAPELGGRAIGYEFGNQSLFYSNPTLFGSTPAMPQGERHAWTPGVSEGEVGRVAEPTASPHPTEEVTGGRDAGPAIDAPDDLEEVPGGGVEEPVADDSPAAERSESIGDTAPTEPIASGEEVPAEPLVPVTDGEPLKYIPSQTSEKYRNYGGQVTWPAPQASWGAAWPPPVPLDLGTFSDEVLDTTGDTVEVVLTSPDDPKLGLRVRKTIQLSSGTTRFRVRNTLINVGERTRTWSVADISQHPGALSPGETFTKDVQVFLPLAAESRHNLGYKMLLGKQTSPQFFPENGLLRLDYLGEETLAGTDSNAGWAAWADKRHGVVMVKLATFDPSATYPEQGLTTTVYTSPGEAESYVQLGFRSPLHQLAPKDEASLTTYYAATNCPLPITHASIAGVVSESLRAEKLGDSVHLTGLFGVFDAGTAQVAFFNDAGDMLARTQPIPVTPAMPFKLDTISVLPDGATRAELLIQNHRRVDVGTVQSTRVEDIEPDKPEDLAIEPEPLESPREPSVPAVNPSGTGPAPTPESDDMPEADEAPATAQPDRPVGAAGEPAKADKPVGIAPE